MDGRSLSEPPRRGGLLRDFLPLRPSVLHPSVTDRNAVMLIRRYKLQIILHLSRGTLTASCEVEGARARGAGARLTAQA